MSNAADKASLAAIQEQLSAVLEERVTELMSHLKASQTLTRQIARTEEEIERHRMLSERLAAELGPLRTEAARLSSETTALQAQFDDVSGSVARLKEIREELQALGLSHG